MKAPFDWEEISSCDEYSTFRAMVEGGWLVTHAVYRADDAVPAHMTTTFVPDPQHNWIVVNEEVAMSKSEIARIERQRGETGVEVGEAMNAGNPGAQDFEVGQS